MTKTDCRAGNRFASLFTAWAVLAAIASVPAKGADLSSLESETDMWIETRMKTAEEKAKWKSDKALLEGSIQVLETEAKALGEGLESNRLAAELYQTGREASLKGIDERRATLDAITLRLDGFDKSIRSLYPRLPEPLQGQIDSMLRKVAPEIEGEPVSAATRMQSLVSVLTTIDQFNNSLNLKHQLRKGADGGTIDVRVLYWGLAAGFAVDGRGTQAWSLSPSDSGWVWQDQSPQAAAIQQMINIYEKKGEPKLIPLNVSIK